jgi:hypothetical protein
MKKEDSSYANYNDMSMVNKDISKRSTNAGDSIPVDSSIHHYELPNLTACKLITPSLRPNPILFYSVI